MLCRLRVSSGALLCSLVGCFHPGGGGPSITESDTDTEGDSMSGPTATEPTTTSISETEPTSPTTPTGNPSDPTGDPSSGPDAECGNGEVEAGEECDDGVNDGSYGGCLEDCSALADYCGDSTVNGPEACDDGTNDNGYGGCATDCAALGPYCGDGTVQNEQEGCDNGDANEDGSGCNVDCVISGTFLLEYESPSVGSCKSSVIEPVFRDDDSVLVAARGYCDNGRQAMIETTADLEEVAFTEYLFPDFPYQATMRGTDWLLGAYSCDYLVAADGTVTEVCDDTRITGSSEIAAIDDELYIALNNDDVAQFGAGSPAMGDTADWTGSAPTDGATYWYYFNTATPAALGTVVAAGNYYTNSGGTYYYYGFVQRFSSAGNPIDSSTYSDLEYIYNIQADSSGALFASGSDPDGTDLMKLNGNLSPLWTIASCGAGNYLDDFELDSAGNVIIECRAEYPDRFLRKLDNDGNELWSQDIVFEFDPTYGRLGIDSTDAIVRAAIVHDNTAQEDRVRLEKYAP